MAKITAFHFGGDWSDAGAEYLVIPDGVDVDAEIEAYYMWLRGVFYPSVRNGKPLEDMGLIGWLKRLGAKEPTDEQLKVVEVLM